jgi:hypothetical protein
MSRRIAHVLAIVLILSQTMAPVLAADSSQVNFKIFSAPGTENASAEPSSDKAAGSSSTGADSMWTEGDPGSQAPPGTALPAPATSPTTGTETAPSPAASSTGSDTASTPSATTPATTTTGTDTSTASTPNATGATGTETAGTDGTANKDGKVLQGYIRVVPSGTKLPIIMDSAIDSDTSQEGDEFAARTSEDLTIDGATVVPAGSVIKGRIARINAPRHLNRTGSIGLKFDTITTPDNHQIALQATLVARGGVVHARRGVKDIAMETGMVTAPMVLGAGIGAIAGGMNSGGSSSIGLGSGLLIGVGVGAAIGVIVLCAKKGKKVDMRPGDELKIELAEDLRMPM